MNRNEQEIINKLNELIIIGSKLIKLKKKREQNDVFELALKINKAFLRNIKRKNPDTFKVVLIELSKLERRFSELNSIDLNDEME